jgi:hypothetical protein
LVRFTCSPALFFPTLAERIGATGFEPATIKVIGLTSVRPIAAIALLDPDDFTDPNQSLYGDRNLRN